MFGNIFLQQQQPQRRAALASGLEARHNDIAHNLFGQSGGIDNHRVQTACFGNQRHQGPVVIGQQIARNRLGGWNRACENDARDTTVRCQCSANITCARHDLQRALGHASLMRQRNREPADGGSLRRWFGDHRVAGNQGGGNLA